MKEMIQLLEQEQYQYAIAVATDAEIAAGAACGQLAIINAD